MVLGSFEPLWGAYLSQFSSHFKILNGFGKWASLSIIRHHFVSVSGPQIWTRYLSEKLRWGLKKTNLKALKCSFRIYQNNDFVFLEKSAAPKLCICIFYVLIFLFVFKILKIYSAPMHGQSVSQKQGLYKSVSGTQASDVLLISSLAGQWGQLT